MSRKYLIHKFIAFLMVFTLAYVQTVLINHQSHHSTFHSHKSPNAQVDAFVAKCVICDYLHTNRSEPALLGSVLVLTVFSKDITSSIIEDIVQLPYTPHDEYTNRGPPIV